MTKKVTSIDFENAINKIVRPSVFDRIVKEINAPEIPAKYVQHILIQYYDGSIVELRGEELTHPIPVNKDTSPENMKDAFKKMRDIKIFISTDKLEIDINTMVEKYLGRHC